jgi:tRNA U34 5-methylaminomethyl-2-thiouridine-forming methyltransferase MnmC
MSNHQLIITADGSGSLYIPSLDETYHSRHGAIQESNHVFIEKGLRPLLENSQELFVFEVGFGTGLNALLTLMTAENTGVKVLYRSIEKYPLSIAQALELNYAEGVDPRFAYYFKSLHEAPWQQWVSISPYFTLYKDEVDLDDVSIVGEADVVYYDAFGPRVQPNMWNIQKLKVACDTLKHFGVFVTYCAQGQFKRVLKELGMEVMGLPGPPGKREMTKAIKPPL